ncbi:Limonoid UDP-glucosyltransferase [Apostasia shenzhenica]|uniref:Limonoid UDP-glucosyltransferase n=1 Tax=Apostasia shenzhenica TaxID=1088818 RepID=A0A2I0AM14_9ASPA|nr:Limonoid UDP-glucosyltransferase [Apostasia shenzhenica]
MGEADPQLHFLFVSFPGQGHVNPLLRLAKRVAAKGPLVTFSTTVDFGCRIRAAAASSRFPFPADSADSGDSHLIPVGRGFLRFEFFHDGGDPNDPNRANLDSLMTRLQSNGPPAVAALIRRQSAAGRPVSCLVNNPFVPWFLDVAGDLGIPGAVLWVQSAAVFSTYFHYHHRLAVFPTDEIPDVTVSLPGIPPLAPGDLPTFLLPRNPYVTLTKVILAQFHNLSKARWVLANSFEELERDTFKALADCSPIVPVGPLVDAGETGENSLIKADIWKAEDHCLEWLDRHEPCSVVYVSVGSVVMLTTGEMAELASGLRNSGRPFLWVVRENLRELLPVGFEEAISEEGRGLVVGWSPQEKVLAHEALGCFVTHCGWNSTLEVLAAGVPVVAYPQWGDQVPDAKFLCEFYGVGVRLPSPAKREEVERCVSAVTEGPEAENMRKRAAEWKAVARAAVASGGSSDRNIAKFVDDVRQFAANGGNDPAFDESAADSIACQLCFEVRST